MPETIIINVFSKSQEPHFSPIGFSKQFALSLARYVAIQHLSKSQNQSQWFFFCGILIEIHKKQGQFLQVNSVASFRPMLSSYWYLTLQIKTIQTDVYACVSVQYVSEDVDNSVYIVYFHKANFCKYRMPHLQRYKFDQEHFIHFPILGPTTGRYFSHCTKRIQLTLIFIHKHTPIL